MPRRGRITAIDRVAGTVSVLLHEPAAGAVPGCARCARGRGCQALFAGAPRAASATCLLPDAAVAARPGIGHEVEVSVPESGAVALQAAALGFGIPTASLVLGSVLGERLGGSAGAATWAVLGGLAGLLIGLAVSDRALRRLSRCPAARPCIDALRIISVAATRPPAPTGTDVDDEPV